MADVPVGQVGYEYRQLKFYKEEVVTVLYIFVSALKGTIALYDFFGLKWNEVERRYIFYDRCPRI